LPAQYCRVILAVDQRLPRRAQPWVADVGDVHVPLAARGSRPAAQRFRSLLMVVSLLMGCSFEGGFEGMQRLQARLLETCGSSAGRARGSATGVESSAASSRALPLPPRRGWRPRAGRGAGLTACRVMSRCLPQGGEGSCRWSRGQLVDQLAAGSGRRGLLEDEVRSRSRAVVVRDCRSIGK